jgi:hypothetical protein
VKNSTALALETMVYLLSQPTQSKDRSQYTVKFQMQKLTFDDRQYEGNMKQAALIGGEIPLSASVKNILKIRCLFGVSGE